MTTIRAVDLGCGAGVLTLATYHYLTEVRGHSVTMTGIDTQDGSDRPSEHHGRRSSGGTGCASRPARSPTTSRRNHPTWCSRSTPATPRPTTHSREPSAGGRATCWQHRAASTTSKPRSTTPAAPAEYGPLLRHGIVRERLGDLLTDSLRAELLRAHGYRTDVIEFVSTEHTAKNLMIRAVRTDRPDPEASAAAERLAATWGVTPALATRIGYRP